MNMKSLSNTRVLDPFRSMRDSGGDSSADVARFGAFSRDMLQPVRAFFSRHFRKLLRVVLMLLLALTVVSMAMAARIAFKAPYLRGHIVAALVGPETPEKAIGEPFMASQR